MAKTKKGKLKKQTQFVRSGYELKISNNKGLWRKIEIWALKKQTQFKVYPERSRMGQSFDFARNRFNNVQFIPSDSSFVCGAKQGKYAV